MSNNSSKEILIQPLIFTGKKLPAKSFFINVFSDKYTQWMLFSVSLEIEFIIHNGKQEAYLTYEVNIDDDSIVNIDEADNVFTHVKEFIKTNVWDLSKTTTNIYLDDELNISFDKPV